MQTISKIDKTGIRPAKHQGLIIKIGVKWELGIRIKAEAHLLGLEYRDWRG